MFALEKEPVLVEKARMVYLPEGTTWCDFWTGKSYTGGQRLRFDAPIEKIPLLVKAGSIIPMGPFVEYSTQKPADPIELRIYTGANGSFTLYEDENDNYNYEKGAFSTINFNWNDADKTLEISDRKGDFPGMIQKLTFNVILVKENHGNGLEISTKPDKTVNYTGVKQTVKF